MEPIVAATWGLVVVTGLLVVISILQYKTVRRQAADERTAAAGREVREQAQLAALGEQAAALQAAASADQAVVAEMIEGRKAENPLQIEVERHEAEPGYFTATIMGVHGAATILREVTLHVGQGVNVPDEPVARLTYGNAYLTGAGGQWIREQFLTPPFETSAGDLLVVRVTGRPANGLEQTREFLYRITAERTLEDLATKPVPQIFWGPGPG
jgi:hypothetical protein